MLFLGLISWKGASCLNGGFCFSDEGGFIFKCVWEGAPCRASVQKLLLDGWLPPTMGNPEPPSGFSSWGDQDAPQSKGTGMGSGVGVFLEAKKFKHSPSFGKYWQIPHIRIKVSLTAFK